MPQSTTAAIMQPTYLPWSGYFNLIARTEHFVFLDDVKLEKCSWHTRNRIPISGVAHYLTVPIYGSRQQMLRDVQINDESRWRRKHSQSLKHAYAHAPYRDELLDALLPCIEDCQIKQLSQLNICIIKQLCELLGISSQFHRSSELAPEGVRSDRLVSLLDKLNVSDYLSPAGAQGYIEKDDRLSAAGIEVCYQNAVPEKYVQQGRGEFIPYMSVIDVIANIGPAAARAYIDDLDSKEITPH